MVHQQQSKTEQILATSAPEAEGLEIKEIVNENNRAKIGRLCRNRKEKTKPRHRLCFPYRESLCNHHRLQQECPDVAI